MSTSSTIPVGKHEGCSRPVFLLVCLLALLILSGRIAKGQHSGAARQSTKEVLPDAAKQRFSEGERLLRQGDLDAARDSVLEGLKAAPRSAEGYDLLGIIYSQQKDFTPSRAAFEHALRLEPGSSLIHFNLGNSYYAQQKLDLAAQEFRSCLRLDPKYRDANYNLGLVLMAQGHPDQAIPVFRRIPSPDASVSLNLLQAYFRAGKAALGFELARTLSDRAGNDSRIHFSLGVLMASEKQYRVAIREFELADSLQPRTFEILHDLGQAYLRDNNPARAEAILNRALLLQPDSTGTMYLLAQSDFDQQKYVPAAEILVRAHKLAPENTDIIFLMGRVSMMQDYFEDAIQILEVGAKIAPGRADLHAALGESYFTTGKLDRARQEFQTLIQLEPSARSYLFMGLSYRHQGKYDEAKKYFNEGLQKDPRNAPCLYNLGFIEHKQGNYPEAEKFLAAALKINPNYDDALYEMAGVKMSQKKYLEAIPLLRRAAAKLPRPAEAYYKLATAERNLHQADAAQRDMKIFETLSKDPEPGPYPYQHLFDSVGQRADLSSKVKAQADLQELRGEVAAHPDRPRDLYLLAEAYLKLGRADDALKTVAQLDQVSGGDARTAVGVGVLLARFGRYPEAIKHFQVALEADPASDDTKYDLANTYFRARAYPQALQVMQQVGESGQEDDAYLGLLGDIYAHLGRTEDAQRIMEKAIGRNPDNDQYNLLLAMIQMQAGDAAAAEATLHHGLARIPDSGRLNWGMGVLSVLQGKNDAAANYFSRAVDFLPEWQTGYSTLGVFYFETGQVAQARETLDRYSELFPHGALNVNQIRQVLANVPQTDSPSAPSRILSPQGRQQFLQTATMMIDQNP
ncbi:MAG TPA: tetratricopeptide repeat protein [Terriglobia bacterium]|nr:tetratricopeptide repeat protein [Terriglobia bacterium]